MRQNEAKHARKIKKLRRMAKLAKDGKGRLKKTIICISHALPRA